MKNYTTSMKASQPPLFFCVGVESRELREPEKKYPGGMSSLVGIGSGKMDGWGWFTYGSRPRGIHGFGSGTRATLHRLQ